MTENSYWQGIRDGLYLALAEARLQHSHGKAIDRLNELVNAVEKGQFRRLRQLLSEIGRGPVMSYIQKSGEKGSVRLEAEEEQGR